MDLLSAFIAALAITLFKGAVAYFIFKQVASRKAAAIAAFWLSFGISSVRYTVSDLPTHRGLIQLCAFVGMILALSLLWWTLLRKAGEEG